MSIRIHHAIATKMEGPLDQLVEVKAPADVPTIDEVLQTMAELAFIVETVAHLQGKEATLLPPADRARTIIDKLRTKVIN